LDWGILWPVTLAFLSVNNTTQENTELSKHTSKYTS